MMALVELLKVVLFVGVVGVTAYYWGSRRGNKISLSQISLYRNWIESSFPAAFVAQFEPHQFQQLVEERLRTALRYGILTDTGRNVPADVALGKKPEIGYAGKAPLMPVTPAVGDSPPRQEGRKNECPSCHATGRSP